MINPTIGGICIGLAAVWLMLSLGRIAGISGIVADAVTRPKLTSWSVLFIVGLAIGGYIGSAFVDLPAIPSGQGLTWPLLLGGLFVGVGTRMGAGCTSGHGVCGVSRLSQRSIVATATFMVVGMLVATAVHGS